MIADRESPEFKNGSAAELEALLSAAVDAILMIDERGRIVEFSPSAERLFGYRAEEIMGKSVNILMPEPDRSSHTDHMKRYMNTGQQHIIGVGREVDARKSTGEVFPAWLSVGEAVHGDKRHFVGIIRDLSAQRAAEREQHALEARLAHVGRFSLMGEMAAGIAHEINQPLSAIETYSQAAKRMLQADTTDQDDLEKACSGIAEQVQRAGQVIENLRNFIRKQEVHKQALDLNEVIKDALSLVEADTNAAGIELTTKFAENLPEINGNAVQLQQVLLNLTHNAVDAMKSPIRKDKEVLIETERVEDTHVQVSVSDRGPGVSPRLVDAIFHPFFTTKRDGLGVGLAISRTIVQSHSGELSCGSNPVGGAVFTVSLPIKEGN